MTSFRIFDFWTKFGRPDFAYLCYRLKEDHPILWEWLDHQEFLGGWTLEADIDVSEYDTGHTLYQVHIVYDNVDDAFLHRMRW